MDKFAYVKELRGRADLTPAEYQLLITLWTYTSADLDRARPGAARLARDLNKSERLIWKQLGALETKGFIVAKMRGGAPRGGRKSANEYTLTLPTPVPEVHGSALWTTEPQVHGSASTTEPQVHGTTEPQVPEPMNPRFTPSGLINTNQSADGLARAGARPPRPRQQQRVIEEKARTTEAERMAEQQRQLRQLSALIGQDIPA